MTNVGVLLNTATCGVFVIVGLLYPAEYVRLYYFTLLSLFIQITSFVFLTSVLMMLIGRVFGDRIQDTKSWKTAVIINEMIESLKCAFVVSGLTTIPVMQSTMGYDIALTWDFNEATHVFDNVILKYLYMFVKTLFIWIAADGWTYFKHSCLHRNKQYLWQFHKQHHAFSNPTSFASFAISPVEALWTFCPILLFSSPAFPFIHKLYCPLQLGLILAFVILNIYLHCGYSLYVVEVTLPYLYINTSTHHNVHHEKTSSNFGEVSPFWDYVFGTYNKQRYLQNKQKFGWRFMDFSSNENRFKLY